METILPSARFFTSIGVLIKGGIVLEQAFLNGQFRNKMGKGPSNRLRSQGRVPGIIYGHGSGNIPVEIDSKELNRLLRYYGESSLVGLDIDGDIRTVLVKEVQRDPVTRHVLHVDFQQTKFDQKIKTVIPVVLVGRGNIEKEGLILQHQLRELEIECFPHNIPRTLQVDVTSMDVGHAMTVADVEIGEEISILNDVGEVIASLTQVRTAPEGEDMAITDDATEDVSIGTDKEDK
jgi:large subunit ribosomal protein L25